MQIACVIMGDLVIMSIMQSKVTHACTCACCLKLDLITSSSFLATSDLQQLDGQYPG